MSGDLGGFSMFELFRGEAEAHCAALNAGLLALEARPEDVAAIEPLMRAAHSIKGAARIIGLDIAVRLAHAMEDVLVAAKKGQERLGTGRIDQLLAGTDLLAKLAAIQEADLAAWSSAHSAPIDELCVRLAAPPPSLPAPPQAAPPPSSPAPADAGTAPSALMPAPPVAPPAAASPRGPEATAAAIPGEGRTVRLNADSVERLMRLAGEISVESRRVGSMRDRFESLKRRLLDLGDALDLLEEADRGSGRIGEVRERHLGALDEVLGHVSASEDLARRIEEVSTSLYHAALGSRMRPFGDVVASFPRMVRDVAKELGKQVRFETLGGAVAVDREILAKLEAPLNHMVRNALDHGIESPEERTALGKSPTARIAVEARHQAGRLVVAVRDDGRGIDIERVRGKIVERGLAGADMAAKLSESEVLSFLFLPGFSTASRVTAISGRGVGLDVVHSFAQEVGGTIDASSSLGTGSAFRLELPISLSVLRAATVAIAGEPYAFPLARIERVLKVDAEALSSVEGRDQILLEGHAIGLVDAAELFGFGSTPRGAELSLVVLGHGRGSDMERYGLLVEGFRGERDVVVRPLDRRFGKVPQIAAGALLESGDPLLIVDVEDLVHSMRQLLAEGRLHGVRRDGQSGQRQRRRRVLVVDDSATVREVERQLLTRLGYEVDVAVDGADGWNAVRASNYDLVVSDVDMPRMNGLEFVAAIRREPRLQALPVIIVSYKDRDEDRIAGMQAGANAYLTKGAFRDDSFARAVRELIGGPERDDHPSEGRAS